MALCTLFYVEERVDMNHYEPHRAKNDHNMKMELRVPKLPGAHGRKSMLLRKVVMEQKGSLQTKINRIGLNTTTDYIPKTVLQYLKHLPGLLWVLAPKNIYHTPLFEKYKFP